MFFDISPIRSAHTFRLTFIHLMRTSQITRMQLLFLCYLIENGKIKDFTVRSVMTKGLSWELANQYLKSLSRIGYSVKRGQLWTITEAGRQFHAKFMEEFNSNHQRPFF